MDIMEIMMTSRQEALLVSIIREYTETAGPISSKFLQKMGFFDLSSATIRAEMNELEGLGYLAQLHTSGGRVPTDRAYRYLVDNLIDESRCKPSAECREKIRRTLYKAGDDPREISKTAAQVLSELSENLVIAGVPERADFFKMGLSGLFEFPEFKETERAFRLASFFDEFEELFGRLEQEFWGGAMGTEEDNKEDIKIFIGRENPVRDIRDETVMLARYNLPHNFKGSLTLVGPTRMDYGKNIGLVKFTTEELNKLAKKI
jgi:heat-inducible transcriptional repressor